MTLTRQLAVFVVVAAALFHTSPSNAQVGAVSGGIAGEVRDTSGAVLPGVTVEAASPALIEKTRSVVTDDRGQYKIVDLRPGVYSVSFTLQGFNTVKREGIELTTGFTATANADLQVGTIEETVTVSGASPVVDTHNVRGQNLLSKEVVDALPTSRTYSAWATLTVGAGGGGSPDVGGDKGEQYTMVSFHGTAIGDSRQMFDGMPTNNNSQNGAGGSHFKSNPESLEEINVEVSGKSGEAESPGVYINLVPKSGGNTFSGSLAGSGSSPRLQANNLTDEIKARGLTTRAGLKQLYDWGGGFGGPLLRDKVWFFHGDRWWGSKTYAPASFKNKTQGTPFYTPDRTQVGSINPYQNESSLRLTWQATPKQKVSAFYSFQKACNCDYFLQTGFRAPETAIDIVVEPLHVAQLSWSYPATNRLMFEVGATQFSNVERQLPQPGVGDSIAITDSASGYQYNAGFTNLTSSGTFTSAYGKNDLSSYSSRYSMSYVTGSHAFKVGATTLGGSLNLFEYRNNQALTYTFSGINPVSVTQWATPGSGNQKVRLNLGVYAQDQWTISRLTLNLALRFDHLNAYVPAQTRSAGRFVGPLVIQEIPNVPNWNDINPRLGAAYDLFGNGKTALKGSMGRYVIPHGTDIPLAVNPATSMVMSTTRQWNDLFFPEGDPRRGNYAPDCDLTSLDLNAECGAVNNRLFGTVQVNTRYSPDITHGWGVRDYQWQATAGIQHELQPGMSLSVDYFRYWKGNFFVTDNLSVGPENYSHFCVTVPSDSRLPGGGGNQLCGLYDVNQDKFGAVNNLITKASNFGDQSEVTNALDFGVKARFGKSRLAGGVSMAQTVTDNCYVIDSPQQKRPGFCHVAPPWSAGTQVKLNGFYPLPWDMQVSAVYQNLPGIAILANRAFSSAEVSGSLGRSLSLSPASVPLVPTGALYENRLSQLDFRFSKYVRIGKVRAGGMIDVYNIGNVAYISNRNNTYGTAAWGTPVVVTGGRLLKFGTQVTF